MTYIEDVTVTALRQSRKCVTVTLGSILLCGWLMTSNVGRESDKFMLRFPDGMRDQLKDEAAKNGRSLNAEIIRRLSDSLYFEAVRHVQEEAGAPDEADFGRHSNMHQRLTGMAPAFPDHNGNPNGIELIMGEIRAMKAELSQQLADLEKSGRIEVKPRTPSRD